LVGQSSNQQVAGDAKLGCRAEVAVNGLEAVRALTRIPYDLVLMDCQMPEMDGFAATRQIRRGSSSILNSRVPIIAMTANALPSDRKRCLEAGMDDYLAKPVQPAELAEKLDRWGPKARGEQRPAEMQRQPAEGADSAPDDVFRQSELLDRLMGDHDLARSIIEGCLSEIPQRSKQWRMSETVTWQPPAARRIKGAALSVGARCSGRRMEELGGRQPCRGKEDCSVLKVSLNG
jgi:CheY-like chemotaxis protein